MTHTLDTYTDRELQIALINALEYGHVKLADEISQEMVCRIYQKEEK